MDFSSKQDSFEDSLKKVKGAAKMGILKDALGSIVVQKKMPNDLSIEVVTKYFFHAKDIKNSIFKIFSKQSIYFYENNILKKTTHQTGTKMGTDEWLGFLNRMYQSREKDNAKFFCKSVLEDQYHPC